MTIELLRSWVRTFANGEHTNCPNTKTALLAALDVVEGARIAQSESKTGQLGEEVDRALAAFDAALNDGGTER